MSFAVQEEVLFNLLFDKHLRSAFVSDPLQALAAFELTESELNDFLGIRPDALELDAAIRIDLILSQMIRHFPLSFTLFSSYPQGVESIKSLVDSSLLTTPPLERSVYFGNALREAFAKIAVAKTQESKLAAAVIEAELAMAYTASSLKADVLEQGLVPQQNTVVPENWMNLPVSLARYVSASVLPLPYKLLKQSLCSCEGAELWRQLNDKPLTVEKRSRLLASLDIRLLLSRAYIAQFSPCEPVVEFSTAELSEGFASLFQYIDGAYTIEFILQELQRAGAEASMVNTIKHQFLQLLESGMLECQAE